MDATDTAADATDTPADAIRATHGNLTAAARRLGMTRSALAAILDADPALAALVDDCRAELVDYAETQLRKAVGAGEEWAVKYALDSARASPRGWRKPSAAQAAQQGAHRPDAAPDFAAMTDDERAAFTRRSLGIEEDGG